MTIEFFKDNGYVKIEGFEGGEVSNLLYNHMLFNEKRFLWLLDNKGNYSFLENWNPNIASTYGFIRTDVASCFSIYGDSIFEGLLDSYKERIESYTGIELIPTYSFSSLYRNGDRLDHHTDRNACEISVTFCLGYSNDEPWPIYVGKGTPILLVPGDIMIYRGIEIPHWRRPLNGDNHIQLFLHYNDKNGPYGEEYLFDKRHFLGLPLGGE